jgi:hypothetical protein
MLDELIEVLKLKGIPNVVPELLPKGMKWRDVLAFVQKHPRTPAPAWARTHACVVCARAKCEHR